MNLKFVRHLAESFNSVQLEAQIHRIEEQYFQSPLDSQTQLLDTVGDYLKALDVRIQMERDGVDEAAALRDLARRMRQLSANKPYSEWLDEAPTLTQRA
ncbi:hypothetical protein [Gloeobacter kilaueensis]|uniref:Uncharacterized protein n=1 Tax=Gloeobacter kilaueensis (strain ATCC BAA-2537 / CCAP 1431/1 / ULC 316 / JS1) TaxID=1183438 RepID=U5QDF8_GLOK1|nr:hypothetical protein [Gloeobacter kilaueensis]AGY56921.1 hypothetical protein GKIL_0675 [Gloeobacter kilaueensis JS1]